MDETSTLTATGAKRRRTLRWYLREAHLWIGLALCLPLVMLGLSGSYLVYHGEIDALFGPGLPQPAQGEPRELGDIVGAARAAAPDGYRAVMLSLPDGRSGWATVRLAPAGAGFRDPRAISVEVDTVSLAVAENAGGAFDAVTRFMHDLHGHLLLPGREGREVVGWLGVAMLALGLSGLVIWWPRRGRWLAALTVRRGARGLRLHRDLHGSVGFWGLAVFVVVSFTGVYIAFPQSFSAAVGAVVGTEDSVVGPSRATPSRATPASGPDLPLEALAAAARDAVGEGRLLAVFMPFRPGQGARARFEVSGAAAGAPTIQVELSPVDGRILAVSDPRTFGAQRSIAAWQRPIHEGGGLGSLWRFLVFLSGLLPLLFSITGIAMWLIKRKARRAVSGRG